MDWNRKIMRVLLLVVTLVAGIPCTAPYKFNGGSIDCDRVRTISIVDFPIKSDCAYTPLSIKLNEDLKDTFLRQAHLRLVNNNTDLQVGGEITGYNQYNQAVSAGGYPFEMKLTTIVSVRSVSNMNHEQDFRRQFSAFRVYDSRELLIVVQDGLIAEMAKEIVDQIFNVTIVNW